MQYLYQIDDQELIYQGFLGLKRYRLRHQCFAGGWSGPLVRERIEGYRAAAVLPYDPLRDELVLIEQFRIGAVGRVENPWLLEVVGGLVEGEEEPEAVARRETLEEAGCAVQRLIPICDYLVTPGSSDEYLSLFCGIVESREAGGIYGLAHEGEDIRACVLPYAEAEAELYRGRINSSAILIAMQWLVIHRPALREGLL